MKIQFWPHTRNKNVASYRLRCLGVISGLNNLGMDITFYKKGDEPDKLILSKRYDENTIKQALELKEKYGTIIYLDLCDNHFYYNSPEPVAIQRAERLRAAIELVDVVITSTNYLAEIIRKESKGRASIVVIGDLVDAPEIPKKIYKIRDLISYIRYRRLKMKLNALGIEQKLRLVWFGNHGSSFTEGGMNDLTDVFPYLENMNKVTPISLTVISNNKEKYEQLTKKCKFHTIYIPWNKSFFSELLFLHGVSLIPIKKNPFTLAKTNNRVTTSLAHGLTVFADEIEDYLHLNGGVNLTKWSELASFEYMHKSDVVEFDSKKYSAAILDKWTNIFSNRPTLND
jgi:hypothetical protein